MNALLIAWLVTLPPVFLVGWAWGRASRRPVIVNFPEWPPINAIKPTVAEVAAALRKIDNEDGPMTALRALRDVTVDLWRAWPDLLVPWLERLTDDLNRWTGKHQ